MKKIVCSFIAAFVFTLVAFSQNIEMIKFKGEEFRDFIAKEAYRYPEFKKGAMYYRDGGAPAKGLMNYNFLLQEMQFINNKGDTMAITDVNSIAYIKMERDTFLYQAGYFEKIKSFGRTSLLLKRSLKFVDEQKTGIFGTTATTGGVVSVDMYSELHEHRLGVNAVLIFARHTSYYFLDARGNVVAANKKNLDKYFKSEASQLEKYIADNKTDLNRQEDLVNLLAYLDAFW